MRYSSETKGRRVIARLAVIGLMSGTVAGCSSDTARFTGFPDFNFGGTQPQPAPDVTGSLGAAPSARVDGAALPPPPTGGPSSYASAAAGQPLYGAPNYAVSAPNYVAPGYTPPSAPVAPRVAGGTHVVQAGETLTSVARIYNVKPEVLGAANNISPGKTVRTGQTLVVPTGGAPVAAPAVAQMQAPAPGLAAAPRTLGTVPAPAPAAVAAAKPLPAPSSVPAPAPMTAAAKPAPAKPAATLAAAPPMSSTLSAPTAAVARAPAPAVEPKVETAAKVSAVAEVEDAPRAAGSGPQFRAPVRGRVVSSFGPKPGGARNDGVNFAVPEGTAVRAAEDGVVAYAGNELKGYGNLVLIKHADGYVTAYAHASALDVKRGDTVRRGQIIAKAGQSGSVQSPQLHFEIRKGSTAVDPSRYVAGL
ncbi:LysM peptidoglycan-binding domain-containing M23 family metallopeptidase [Xanthobacter sp. V4C-4]|uniref:peptidoglycan DD-metalloendopeptidase family protein n=1 Tax=Xanthobacter cornucopiae TaxID=3119924 RepID=UPI00372B9F4B